MTFASPTDLQPTTTDVAAAPALANAHYISDERFEEEKRSVLFANWAGVGFGKDLPEPGFVKPIRFLGLPLLLVRDHEGEIAVFQNTCRHRGMILVSEPTTIRKVLRCPYHSWCYGLDGALKVTPHVGGPGINTHESIRNDDLGLFRVSSAVWADVIFVNVSGTAEPFDRYIARLSRRWADFEQPCTHDSQHGSFALDVKTNWKLAVENFCESYHLPWIHPGLNSYSKLQDHYNIEAHGAFSGQGTLVYRQLQDQEHRCLPDFPGIGEQWNTGAEYISLYPNVLLGVHRDHRYAIVLEPVSVERTIEHIALYYTESGALDSELDDLRQRNASLWKGIFEEDIHVVEGMQAGRHGSLFDGGTFSPVMDAPTQHFHHWVAHQFQQRRQSDSGLEPEPSRSTRQTMEFTVQPGD